MQKNVNLINHILSLPQPRQMSCKTSWGERNKNANWTLIEVFLLAFIILISWTSSYVILMDFHMEIFHMHFLASTPFPTYNDREAFFCTAYQFKRFRVWTRAIYWWSQRISLCLLGASINWGKIPRLLSPRKKSYETLESITLAEKRNLRAVLMDR